MEFHLKNKNRHSAKLSVFFQLVHIKNLKQTFPVFSAFFKFLAKPTYLLFGSPPKFCSVSHVNFWNDFCLPHATFSIGFVLQGCCLEKPTKYDVNKNSSESFIPDKPVDQVHCSTLKLAKPLSGAPIVVIAGEHKALTNKQTNRQTDRETGKQTERRTNKHFRAAFPSAAAAVASLQLVRFMPSSHNLRHCSCPLLLRLNCFWEFAFGKNFRLSGEKRNVPSWKATS